MKLCLDVFKVRRCAKTLSHPKIIKYEKKSVTFRLVPLELNCKSRQKQAKAKAGKSRQKQAKANKSRQKQPKKESNFEFSLIKVVQYTIPIGYQPQKQTKADKSRQKQAKATLKQVQFQIFINKSCPKLYSGSIANLVQLIH